MKYDVLIKGGNLYHGNGDMEYKQDIGIKDGFIIEKGENLSETEAEKVIDAKGMLVSPGFLDTHMHIDLSYTFDYTNDVPSLIGGAKMFPSYFDKCYSWTKEEMYEDITRRSAQTIDACIVQGTTGLKTNVTYMNFWKGMALDSMVELKERYKDKCDVFNCVTFTHPEKDEIFELEVVPEWEQAARDGKIEFVSGYPHKHPDGKAVIDSIFAHAKEFNLPIDIHCNESDVPDLGCFEYVIDKTIEEHMEGKVTMGHVTALSSKMMSDEEAKRLIEKAARAQVNVTTLTSCNMYLMNDNRRGPTRVEELLNAGVNVAVASDDIREVLRPYGNCDLLEEALLTAQVHKFGTVELLRTAFDTVTYNGAKNCLLEHYGVKPGCQADIVILEAPTPEAALLDQCKKPYVLKKGKVVASYGKLV